MSVESYRDLMVWQKAIILAKEIYQATKCFPKEELYGLTSQMRRSAVSIPSNIAEGYGRQSRGDYIDFLKIAQGSVAELDTEMVIASEIGFAPKEMFDPLHNALIEIQKMLRALIRSLKNNGN